MRRTPLVGRETELTAVQAAVRDCAGSGVVLYGSLGAGKTRLLRTAADAAHAAGIGIAHLQVTRAAATMPLAAAAALLPDTATDPTADPLGLFRTAGEHLRRRTGGGPVVALVDDAHLLDDGSAALIHHLVTSGALRTVMAVRQGEPCPDAVTSLWKDGWSRRLDLGPLTRDDVARLVAATLDGPVDGAVPYRIWHLSQGNALAVAELLDQALASGAVRRVRGRWHQAGPLLASDRLRDVVHAWLAPLGPAATEAAQLVALAGPVGLALARQVVDADALGEAEEHGVVAVATDRRRVQLGVTHPLSAALLVRGTGHLRRQALLAGLADALGATGARRHPDRTTLALWRLDGGQPVPAEELVSAASAARSAADHATARRLAQAALDTGGGLLARHLVAEARLWEGTADRYDGGDVDAHPPEPALAPADEAQVLIGRATALFIGERRASAAEVLLDAAEQRLGALVGGEVAALRAAIAISRGDVRRALRAVTAYDDPAIGPVGRVGVGTVGVSALTRAGRPEEALRLADRVATSAPPEATAFTRMALTLTRVAALGAAGRTAEAERLAAAGYESVLGTVPEDERASWRGAWAASRGHLLLGAGRALEAVTWLGEAAALMAATVAALGPAAHTHCLSALAEAHALLGQVDAAVLALAEADAVAPDRGRGGTGDAAALLRRAGDGGGVLQHADEGGGVLRHVGDGGDAGEGVVIEVEAARVWVAVARGEVSAARDLAAAVADVAGGLGAHGVQVRVLHDVARLGDPRRVLDEITAVAAVLEGPVPAARAVHVRALATRDPQALEAVAATLQDAGLELCAAEAAAQAALALGRAGLRARALDALATARRLAERCGWLSTPDLVLTDHDLPLTRRQREIATLAAAGLSSRAIAERLVISVRTVDNHLHHVYTKLGITDRESLAAVLAAHGPPPVA